MAARDDVRARLEQAAVQGMLTHGPQVSVETIADIAKVGRRTAFRYFSTREELLAAGVDWVIDGYIESMPTRDGRPVETWLRDLARKSAAFMAAPGPRYVALIVADWESDAMRSVMARRAEVRRAFSEQVATDAWQAVGRRGRPPRRLVHACLVCLGPFVHYALRTDGGMDIDAAGRAGGDLLVDVFRVVTSPGPRTRADAQ